jgi:hypothetical protein
MAKIPGFVYLIIGAVMVGFSLITNSRTKTQSMTVFIYIGLLFFAIGIAKVIFNYVTKDKKPETQHQQHPHHAQHPGQHTHQQAGLHNQSLHQQTHPQHIQTQHGSTAQGIAHHYPQHSEQQSIFPQVIACRRCSARNPIEASFCNRCGFRLK